MDSEQGKKLLYAALAVIVLLLLSTAGGFILNSKTRNKLNDEKLRSESLLSEKLLAEKEVNGLNTRIAELSAKVDELNNQLAASQETVAERDKRIASLSRSVSGLAKARAELEAVQKAKSELDNSYSLLRADYDKLVTQNSGLQQQMAELEALKNDLDKKLQQETTYESDNFVTYGSRGKKTEKLTIRAFWTKKINLNFEVPQTLTETISFKMTTPDGKVISPDDKALSWKVTHDYRDLTASLSSVSGQFEQSRQVSLSYTSTEKLAKGEYKIQVMSNDIVIGNCRVRLK